MDFLFRSLCLCWLGIWLQIFYFSESLASWHLTHYLVLFLDERLWGLSFVPLYYAQLRWLRIEYFENLSECPFADFLHDLEILRYRQLMLYYRGFMAIVTLWFFHYSMIVSYKQQIFKFQSKTELISQILENIFIYWNVTFITEMGIFFLYKINKLFNKINKLLILSLIPNK